jgi:hypothetical protein
MPTSRVAAASAAKKTCARVNRGRVPKPARGGAVEARVDEGAVMAQKYRI